MTGGIAKLVHTGIPNYGASTSNPIKLYVYHKSRQDEVNNKSIVSVGQYVVIPANYPVGPWKDYYGSYVGTEDNIFDGSIAKTTGTVWLAENKTFEVEHDSEGKGKATIYWKWGVYSEWGQFENESGSFEVTLPTIPRASTIGATDANVGSKSTIVVSRKSTSFAHSVAYAFGDLTGYITAAGGVSATEVKFSETSISWTIPSSFYEQIPNAKTGVCTLTIRTYSGTTQIGNAQTDSFTVTASKEACTPDVSGVVVDTNASTNALTGDDTRLVRYKSTAHCTISATPKNGAAIVQQEIGGAVMADGTRDIPEVEVNSISFYALDSRGYSRTVQVDFELIPYVILTCNPVGKRTNPTDGNAILTIKGEYYNGSFGAADNVLSIMYRVKPDDGEYGDYMEAEPTLSGNSYSASVNLSGLDYELSHTIEVVATDAVGAVTKTTTIDMGIPVYDWGKKDFRFNVLLRLAESLEAGKHLYLGKSNYAMETGVSVPWADEALHWLVYRLNDGLTSGIGWPGVSDKLTTTVIRGNTVQCQNASGTTVLSDERLKKDFADLEPWGAFFAALEPCAFKLKAGSSGRYHIGFKAQQVADALRAAGLTSQDFAGLVEMTYQPAQDDPDSAAVYEAAGILPGDSQYGLIYPEFTALNTYIIQRLQGKISAMTQELEALKNQMKEGGMV